MGMKGVSTRQKIECRKLLDGAVDKLFNDLNFTPENFAQLLLRTEDFKDGVVTLAQHFSDCERNERYSIALLQDECRLIDPSLPILNMYDELHSRFPFRRFDS